MIKQTQNIRQIDLYPITIYSLYQECLDKAGLLNQEKLPVKLWPILLYDKLKEVKEIDELFQVREWRADYHNYLRDKYNFAMKMVLNGNLKIPKGYQYDKILPLLIYAARLDIKAFEEQLVSETAPALTNGPIATLQANNLPVEFPALYSPTAFGRSTLYRNPEKGKIFIYPNGDLVFDGQKCVYIKRRELVTTSVQAMYGDEKNWVKVSYEKNGKIQIVYFAEAVSDGNTLKLIDPENILAHFSPSLDK